MLVLKMFINFLLMAISRFILTIFGWDLLTDSQYQILNSQPRSVVVFSHSSYYDLIIFTLYGLAYPNRQHKLRTLITPNLYDWSPKLFDYCGGIVASRVEDKNGLTGSIIDHLSQLDKFVFFISPKGTVRNTPWRTGYYHIAKELDVPIIVAGLDYEKQKVFVSLPIYVNDSEPEIQKRCIERLKSIVPYNLHGEVSPDRKCYPSVVSFKFLARVVLWIMDWKPMSNETVRRLCRPGVIVFSHTTYFDFIIFVLYRFYHVEMLHCKAMIKPGPFKYFGRLLEWLGGVEATDNNKSGGNAVQRIVSLLEPEASLLISPKGTMKRNNWRSGYYHIARLRQVPVRWAGADYEKHEIVVGDDFDIGKSEAEIEDYLKTGLSNIVPMYPECEVVEIRKHEKFNVVNWWRVISVGLVCWWIF